MSDPNFPETAQDTLQTCGSEQHVVAWILAVALQLWAYKKFVEGVIHKRFTSLSQAENELSSKNRADDKKWFYLDPHADIAYKVLSAVLKHSLIPGEKSHGSRMYYTRVRTTWMTYCLQMLQRNTFQEGQSCRSLSGISSAL